MTDVDDRQSLQRVHRHDISGSKVVGQGRVGCERGRIGGTIGKDLEGARTSLDPLLFHLCLPLFHRQ